MVKKPRGAMARSASLASRFSTRTARISPAGGVSSPNRLRSALLKGRSQAKNFLPTIHVRLPHFVATVTFGRLIASVWTSAKVIRVLSLRRLTPAAFARRELDDLVARVEGDGAALLEERAE